MHPILLLPIATVLLFVYTYLGYPALLLAVARFRKPRSAPVHPAEWPSVTITVPAYNEEAEIASTLDRLTSLDYPRERLQILVVSDASTDRTEEIVARYADRGVELLRMPTRRGKTAAENAAQPYLRGEIIVNTDASIRLARDALRPLVAPFVDPSIGVVSARDISVTGNTDEANSGEGGYVSYEMWVRQLETRISGIIGASGCCYAIRAHLHRTHLPAGLSRDFASALVARDHGYRAVSAPQAACFVPRTASLGAEYRRKVRTITRGIETLHHMRHLLNPLRYGMFSVMLWSHKICRWLIPWFAAATLLVLAAWGPWPLSPALVGLALSFLAAAVAATLFWPAGARVPAWVAFPAFVAMGNFAALHAATRALRGDRNAVWEPTRRQPTPSL